MPGTLKSTGVEPGPPFLPVPGMLIRGSLVRAQPGFWNGSRRADASKKCPPARTTAAANRFKLSSRVIFDLLIMAFSLGRLGVSEACQAILRRVLLRVLRAGPVRFCSSLPDQRSK